MNDLPNDLTIDYTAALSTLLMSASAAREKAQEGLRQKQQKEEAAARTTLTALQGLIEGAAGKGETSVVVSERLSDAVVAILRHQGYAVEKGEGRAANNWYINW